jgi:diguanylate cyclase (GGDEF)-like protein/PAS domain S-box-containing protein
MGSSERSHGSAAGPDGGRHAWVVRTSESGLPAGTDPRGGARPSVPDPLYAQPPLSWRRAQPQPQPQAVHHTPTAEPGRADTRDSGWARLLADSHQVRHRARPAEPSADLPGLRPNCKAPTGRAAALTPLGLPLAEIARGGSADAQPHVSLPPRSALPTRRSARHDREYVTWTPPYPSTPLTWPAATSAATSAAASAVTSDVGSVATSPTGTAPATTPATTPTADLPHAPHAPHLPNPPHPLNRDAGHLAAQPPAGRRRGSLTEARPRLATADEPMLAVLEAVGVGVVLSQPDGTTIAVNSRARQLLDAPDDVNVVRRTVPGSAGTPELVVATILPITPPAAAAPPTPPPSTAQRDLAESRFTSTLQHSPVGFAVLSPSGEILDANPALSRLLARPVPQLLGSRLQDFTHPDEPDADARLIGCVVGGGRDSNTLERRYLRPRGQTIWARTTVTAIRDAAGTIDQLVAQLQDVSEVRLAEQALAHQALHDPLTGLPNRTLMLDRIQQALDRTRRTHRRVAVLCCALDRFDVVNDGVGHEHGDAVLVEVGHRLERILRSTDTAARLQGGEFALVCEDVQDEREAVLVADRVLAMVREPMDVGGRRIVQTITIGIAVSSARAADADSLLRDAGTALHRAQQQGQDRWDVADDELRKRAVDRLDIEHALRAALHRHDLRVFFQPIVDLTTRAPVGHEALVRWQHPSRGLLPPALFLPVAEETGLIEDIGRWVLLEAARATAARPSNGYVAVNVSASQVMRAGLVADVEAVLEETGLPASRLVVELTESVMLEAAPAGRQELHKLDDLGVRVVVDDFGTGFSALSYLRDLPVSGIKVDRSFTAGLGEDAQCERIVEALTGLAGGLGVDLVAEGVETERQRTMLSRIGCVHAQGFLFGRPAPHPELGAG